MKSETKLIKPKLGLLQLAQQLGNLSQVCKIMSYSRDSFYRLKDKYDTGGDIVFQEISHRKPIPKNRMELVVYNAAVLMAFEQPLSYRLESTKNFVRRGYLSL